MKWVGDILSPTETNGFRLRKRIKWNGDKISPVEIISLLWKKI